MDQNELTVQPRTVIGKGVKVLRREGIVPLVVYGRSAPVSAQAPELDVARAIAQAGGQLITLTVAGESTPRMVLARELQRDVLTGRLLHADLYEVDITERIQVTVSLALVGEPALIESNEAVLLQVLNEVEIECLPTEIMQSIEVQISGLVDFGDAVYVRDIVLPDGIDMVTQGDEMVARLDTIEEEEEEEVEEELFAPVEPGEVEVIGRERDEEELEDE
ncbi:MAG: 50S ribosomal protein L25 [Anaerolineae bacterium]|nr:50S ribosomal protein L25 [Anaerolineae bacterium]